MNYLKLIWKRAFSRTITLLGGLSTIVAVVADAIWGDNKPVQFLAEFVIAITVIFVLIRLILAPYQIWNEDQAKIEHLENAKIDPLNDRKSRLSGAAAEMLSSAKSIYNEWSVSNEKKKKYLRSDYASKRRQVSELSDGLLEYDDVYRAAQDAMNRCDILMDDSVAGHAGRDVFSEAHDYTKRLLILLSTSNSS